MAGHPTAEILHTSSLYTFFTNDGLVFNCYNVVLNSLIQQVALSRKVPILRLYLTSLWYGTGTWMTREVLSRTDVFIAYPSKTGDLRVLDLEESITQAEVAMAMTSNSEPSAFSPSGGGGFVLCPESPSLVRVE